MKTSQNRTMIVNTVKEFIHCLISTIILCLKRVWINPSLFQEMQTIHEIWQCCDRNGDESTFQKWWENVGVGRKERELERTKERREFQLRLMMGHGMHSSFGLPHNQHNLGQSSSMDQSSSPLIICITPDHLKMISKAKKKILRLFQPKNNAGGRLFILFFIFGGMAHP